MIVAPKLFIVLAVIFLLVGVPAMVSVVLGYRRNKKESKKDG